MDKIDGFNSIHFLICSMYRYIKEYVACTSYKLYVRTEEKESAVEN